MRKNDRQKLDSVVPMHLDGVVVMNKSKCSYQLHQEARANSFKHRANSFKSHMSFKNNIIQSKQKLKNVSISKLPFEEDQDMKTVASVRSSQDSKSNLRESVV
jgi:hypothetical protein